MPAQEVFISSKADLLQAQQHNRFHFSQAALRQRWAAMGPVALALPAAAASAGIVDMGEHGGMMRAPAAGAIVGVQPYPVPYRMQYGGQPVMHRQVQGPAALADAFTGGCTGTWQGHGFHLLWQIMFTWHHYGLVLLGVVIEQLRCTRHSRSMTSLGSTSKQLNRSACQYMPLI